MNAVNMLNWAPRVVFACVGSAGLEICDICAGAAQSF